MMPMSSHGPAEQEPIIVEVEGIGELEFPDGTDPSVIQAKVKELTGGGAQRHPHAKVADWVKENAPMVGGMAAGLASGGAGLIPAAIAAAGGGFLGARLRGDDRTTAAMEGAKQGATDLAGGVITKGLVGGARRLYTGLLKPSKALRGEFPGVADDLLKNRRLITQRGADAAESAVEGSSAAAERLITQAAPTATDIPARELVSEFGPVVEAVRNRVRAGVVPESELAKIGQRGARLVKTAGGKGQGVPIAQAQPLKKAAQDAAAGAYKQMRAGHIKQLGTDDLLDAATARGFKQGLEKRVPGLGAQNKTTQGLVGQLRALQDAVGRTGNHLPFGSVSDLAAMTAGSVIPGAGIVGKAATMAGPGSAMAIGANELARLPMAQLLRLAQMQQLESPE